MNEFSVVIDTSKDNYVQLKLGYKHASGWHFLGDNFKIFSWGSMPPDPSSRTLSITHHGWPTQPILARAGPVTIKAHNCFVMRNLPT